MIPASSRLSFFTGQRAGIGNFQPPIDAPTEMVAGKMHTNAQEIAYKQASPSAGKSHPDDLYVWHRPAQPTGYWINRDGHSYPTGGERGHKDIAEVKWTLEIRGQLWRDGASQQYLRNLGYIRVKIDRFDGRLFYEPPTNHHSPTKKQLQELQALSLRHDMSATLDRPAQSNILRWRSLPDPIPNAA